MTSKKALLQTIDYNKLGPLETRVLDLWGRGITNQRDIVERYNETFASVDGVRKINLMDVGRAIKKIKRLVLAESINDFRDIVMEETMEMYREAKESWLESKEDLVIVTETRMETDKGFSDTVSEKRQPQTGNPSHWANAMRALETIRNLMGLDSPKKIGDILAEEMVLILDYLEVSLTKDAFEEVMKVLANYQKIDIEEEVVVDDAS